LVPTSVVPRFVEDILDRRDHTPYYPGGLPGPVPLCVVLSSFTGPFVADPPTSVARWVLEELREVRGPVPRAALGQGLGIAKGDAGRPTAEALPEIEAKAILIRGLRRGEFHVDS